MTPISPSTTTNSVVFKPTDSAAAEANRTGAARSAFGVLETATRIGVKATTGIDTGAITGSLSGADQIKLNEDSFQRMFSLQQNAQRDTLEYQTKSNVSKVIHDANSNTVRNIKA